MAGVRSWLGSFRVGLDGFTELAQRGFDNLTRGTLRRVTFSLASFRLGTLGITLTLDPFARLNLLCPYGFLASDTAGSAGVSGVMLATARIRGS